MAISYKQYGRGKIGIITNFLGDTIKLEDNISQPYTRLIKGDIENHTLKKIQGRRNFSNQRSQGKVYCYKCIGQGHYGNKSPRN